MEPVSSSFFFIVIIVAIALPFDFTNGMQDAANSVATVVSTRVLSPRQAVVWAAFFNFIAFLFFGTHVATTIGIGLIDINVVNPHVIFCGLLSAIIWNILTVYWGIPASASHALIGGYLGAAVAEAGFGVIIVKGWIKVGSFIFIAPLLGMVLGNLLMIFTTWLVRKQPLRKINPWSRRLQLFSAALYSLGHGGKDAQKTMGIIASLIFTSGHMKTFHIPLWVVLSAYPAIALGTLSDGWRVIKTTGQKIIRLRPIDGFCAETASAISIFMATHLGIPVSTIHVITGAVTGVGAARSVSSVKWQVTLKTIWAWILTIPMSALIAALIYRLSLLSF